MVGRFLRLRLALFRAGFRTGNVGMSIATVFGLIVALLIGLMGMAGGIALRWAPDTVRTIAVPVALTGIYLVWLLGPLTVAGTDSAMDPVKFVLLPLSRWDLATGLAAAGLVGPGGLATILAVIGLVGGLAPAGPGLIGVVLGGVLFLALCILSSRCLVSLVGIGLRRRGLRDVLAVAIPLTVILLGQMPNIVQNLLRAAGPGATRVAIDGTLRALRFLPTSFPATAMVEGQRNQVLRPLVELAGGIVLCVLLGWAWSLLLRRVMTTPPGVEGAAKERKGKGFRVQALFPRLPRRAVAVANKDLTLMFREPAQRVQLIMAAIFGLAAAIIPGFFSRLAPLAFIGAGLGLFLGMANSNQYGYDGSSMWVNVAAGDDARNDLLGKIVARLLVFTPLVLVATAVLGLIVAPPLLPATLGCALGVWCLCLGLATVQSVVAPYPVVYSEDSVMPRNQGSFQAMIAQMIVFPIVAVLMGPLIFAGIWWRTNPLVVIGVGLLALAIGVVGLYLCFRLAVRYGANRQPELLQQVSKRVEA